MPFFSAQTRHVTLAAFAVCLSNCASADERVACAVDTYIEAKSMAALPETIRLALTDALGKSDEISDAGGPFNAGDLGGPPHRRLVLSAIGLNHIVVALEHGGAGYSVEVWNFRTGIDGWSGGLQTIGTKLPKSSQELVGLACR